MDGGFGKVFRGSIKKSTPGLFFSENKALCHPWWKFKRSAIKYMAGLTGGQCLIKAQHWSLLQSGFALSKV